MVSTFAMSGVFQVFSLFLLGGGIGVPLGIPPAAEDPAMARIAPKECLFYMTWSGAAAADPQSHNQAEQLLAEKEVQQSLQLLEEQIVAGFRVAQAGDPQAVAMVDDVRTVAKAVLTSPAAVFISKLQPPRNGPPDVRGGAMVNLGERAPEIAKSLGRIEAQLTGKDAVQPAPRMAAGWRRIPLGMHDPHANQDSTLQWAVKGGYLVIGLGEGEADKVMERVRQEPPAWLKQLRGRLTVPRPANLVYVNVAELVKLAGGGEPELAGIFAGLGLAQVQSMASITGLDDAGCVTRTQVTIDGEPKGLLSVLDAQPLTKGHLTAIPKDATIALAARLDAAKIYKQLLEITGRIEPTGQQELLGGVRQFEARMKLKLYEDILQSLGDTWRVYTSPSEGNLVFTGLTAVVDIRNHDRLVATNAKLVFSSLLGGIADDATQPGRGQPQPLIKQIKYGTHTIFYLTRLAGSFPFYPAWCITDKEMVIALFPQNVKAYLERADQNGASSLADVQAMTGALEANKPIAVSYVDVPTAFKLAYPIVQVLLGFASSEMGRGGPVLDISLLPPAPSIGRHLRPSVTTVSRTKEGIVVETHQTLPIGVGGLPFLAPLWMFAAEGPSSVGPMPTRQNVSLNNMKQLGLALFSYQEATGTLPPTAAGQKPKQPPVSWRVLILPYLEEAALYQQYRFDEAWDSENNKKLIPRIPNVFKAPGSRKAAEGRTNYLAVVGDSYALAADKARPLVAFTDGLSNTILLVEANDEHAVPWTKPEDFTPDKAKPISGLTGLRQDRFLALAADGAVHVVPAEIRAETLHGLFTRAGGEVVSFPEPGAVHAVAEPVAPEEIPESALPVERPANH